MINPPDLMPLVGPALPYLGAARARLSRATLRGLGKNWRLATPGEATPGVFASPHWLRIKAPADAHLSLIWTSPEGLSAHLAIQDAWLPGALRQWTVLTEPQRLKTQRLKTQRLKTQPRAIHQPSALRALMDLARANGVDELVGFSNMARWTDPELPQLFEPHESEPFGTYVVDLSGDDDARRMDLHKKHRYQLKQANKAGVEIRHHIDPELFTELMARTYERGGKARPFSAQYINTLLTDRSLPMLVRSAWHEGECQAVVVVPYDTQRGYFLHGATAHRPTNGSAVLAHMAVMTELAALGVPQYDLGGARAHTEDPRLQGIFRFKQRFGGPFEACTRFRCALHPKPSLGLRLLRAYRAR